MPYMLADVDHPRGIAAWCRRGGAQQRQTELSQVRDRFDIEIDDLGPALVRKRFEGCAPRGAGSVDQHVELIDVSGEPLAELAGPGFGGQVAGDEADGPVGAEFVGGGGQFVLLAAGDENPCTRLQQAAGDHLADSAPTTGDQRGLAIKRKQISHRPFVSATSEPGFVEVGGGSVAAVEQVELCRVLGSSWWKKDCAAMRFPS
jgi:hypothetical protein